MCRYLTKAYPRHKNGGKANEMKINIIIALKVFRCIICFRIITISLLEQTLAWSSNDITFSCFTYCLAFKMSHSIHRFLTLILIWLGSKVRHENMIEKRYNVFFSTDFLFDNKPYLIASNQMNWSYYDVTPHMVTSTT